MAVSTQVESDRQVLSMAYVQNMSTVDQYKTLLTQIRLQRTGLIAQMRSLMEDIQGMTQAHDHMLEQFQLNAVQMYPQYQGQDLKAIISSLPSSDPLVQMWLTSSQNINDVRNGIVARNIKLDQLMSQELAAQDQEKQTLDSYTDFASQATTTVPTTEELIAGLVAVSVIPVEEEKSLIASLPAIEYLSEEAANDVTLQIVQGQEQSAIDLAMSAQDTQIQPAEQKLHPAIFFGAGALAFWILLGGSK